MKALSSREAREQFIKFFESKGHTFWRSSAVVPYNDPTLLFVNAGMCQYKPIFLGDADKSTEFGQLVRACNTQKCIRAGGKHNDLEDVGKDVYHHTFFEMLGNWSFADYFKEEAIEFAWELLTEVYGLDPARLYATYFGGDEKSGLGVDVEARDFWLKKLPASHVLPGSLKENFWEMGDTGPCGPCSELHFDRIGNRECPELVNQDDPDVLEVWNLVFMQFNREASGKLTPLPAGCVDTGMGLERLVSILNNVRSNYDTDLFVPLFAKIRELCPDAEREYQGNVGAADEKRIDLAYRAVADHIRTLSIAIADGAVPSNEGRGYVLRRVLRRAVRYGRQVLNAPKNENWLTKLVPTVVETLGCAFPELEKHQAKIQDIIADEEKQFGRTLDRGTALFKRAVSDMKAGDMLDGKICFELFATYGFPLDLTQVMCEENNLLLDLEGFQRAMEEHHKNSEGNADRKLIQHLTPDKLASLSKDHGVSPTQDSSKYDWTPGKGQGPDLTATVKAIYDGTDFVASADTKVANIFVILDKTNFYAESGGQIGDTGFASVTGGTGELTFVDTKKMGGFVLHVGQVVNGQIHVGDQVTLSCDFQRRAHTAKNHTGTHCLNLCLRDVLGEGVDQAGSIVDPARLRFDFTSQKALTLEDIEKLETGMRQIIERALPVHSKEVPLAQAKTINGLRCLAGENYPDPVRVLSVGKTFEELLDNAPGNSGCEYSVEFCGGTHLANSSEIGEFVILSEESISRGVRRITAMTGDAAHTCLSVSRAMERRVQEVKAMPSEQVSDSLISSLKEELKAKKDTLSLLARKRSAEVVDALVAINLAAAKKKQKALKKEAEVRGTEAANKALGSGAKFVVSVESEICGDFKAMEEYMTAFSKVAPQCPVLLISQDVDSPVNVLVNVPKTATSKGQANAWTTATFADLGGKGGGSAVVSRGSAPSTTDIGSLLSQAHAYATRF